MQEIRECEVNSDEVRVQLTTLRDLDHGIASFQRDIAASVQNAVADLRRLTAAMDLAYVHGQRDVRQAAEQRRAADEALRRCRENCDGLRRASERYRAAEAVATSRLREIERARSSSQAAATDLGLSLNTSTRSVAEQTQLARSKIKEFGEALNSYLRVGG